MKDFGAELCQQLLDYLLFKFSEGELGVLSQLLKKDACVQLHEVDEVQESRAMPFSSSP